MAGLQTHVVLYGADLAAWPKPKRKPKRKPERHHNETKTTPSKPTRNKQYHLRSGAKPTKPNPAGISSPETGTNPSQIPGEMRAEQATQINQTP